VRYFALLLLIVACDQSPGLTERPLVDEVDSIQSKNIRADEKGYIGSGKILMTSQLRSPRDSFHINLEGQFFEGESSLVLHLFLDDFTYDTGIQILFRRGDGDGEDPSHSVEVSFAEPGFSFRPLTIIKEAVNHRGEFNLRIETINRLNNDRRILIWNNKVLLNSTVRIEKDKILAGNADFDSAREGLVFYSWGQGYRWGVDLNNFRINLLRREAPYVDL
jgi:hypothetical protein